MTRHRFKYQLAALLLMACTALPVAANDWYYYTREGDTLWDLCMQYSQKRGCWLELARYNNMDQDQKLPVKTLIRIPVAWLKSTPVIGTVANTRGKTEYSQFNDGQFKPLAAGQDLHLGALIRTGDGSARLHLQGGNELLMRANSQLILESVYPEGDESTDSRLLLDQGSVETRVKKDVGNRFQIQTPSAIAAVRGTAFRMTDHAGTTHLEVTEGVILVATGDQEQEVVGGFGVIAEVGESVAQPRQLLPAVVFKGVQMSAHLPVEVSWNALEGATEYQVDLYDQQGGLLGSQFIGVPDFRFEALGYGCYLVQVRAVDVDGLKGLDAQTDFCFQPFLEPVALAASDLSIQGNDVFLQWAAGEDDVRYQVDIAGDPDFEHLLDSYKSGVAGIRLPDRAADRFYLRVSTVAEDGRQSPYSNTLTYAPEPAPEPQEKYPTWAISAIIVVLISIAIF